MAAPLDPSATQARDQLAHELAHPSYWVHRDLADDLLRWLWRTLTGHASGRGVTGELTMVLVYLVLAVLAGFTLSWIVRAGRGASAASGGRRGSSVLVREGITAQQYLERARRALDAGDTDTAVADGFRSLVVTLDRSGVLGDEPARTAHEVALLTASALPHEAGAVDRAARWFDVAAYGVAPAPRTDADQARDAIALAERLAGTGAR